MRVKRKIKKVQDFGLIMRYYYGQMSEFTPINLNTSYTEQAIAGSSGAIFTSTDREIIKKRSGEVELNRNFKELVKEFMSNSIKIDKTEIGEKENVDRENMQTRIKIEKRLIKHAPNNLLEPKEKIQISDEAMKGPQDNFRKEEAPIDEFAVLYGHKLLGIPVDEERLEALSKSFKEEELKNIKEQVAASLKKILLSLLRESFYKNMEDPKLISGIILNSKNGQKLLDYFANKEDLDLVSILGFAKEFNISFDAINKLFSMEKIRLSKEEIKAKMEEEKKKNEIFILEETLKSELTKMLISDNIMERYTIVVDLNLLKIRLESLGVPQERINSLILEGKKLAWLKSVIILKDLHLKRVLSTSKKEFEDLSKNIKSHTIRARKLGLRISREGVKWVEAKLEAMAIETAAYKIKLFESMQKISFDKEREKDLLWLNKIMAHLKKTPES